MAKNNSTNNSQSNKRKNTIITDTKKNQKNNDLESIIIINKEIKTLQDLIDLGGLYQEGKKYNINLEKINKIMPLLDKLNKVIGMDGVKNSIIGQIIYFLQDFQNKNEDMMHTVIQGPPGVGKTLLGHLIGQIYWELDIIQSPEIPSIYGPLPTSRNDCCDDDNDDDDFIDDDDDDDKNKNNKKSMEHLKNIIKAIRQPYRTRSNSFDEPIKKELKFKVVKRSDLIGKYLGHTAAKTQSVIDSALGGVLFIDEAYSLGNAEGRDSFAKECIDTINQNLTEKKNQILVIIAGYQESLETCFFAYNDGLNRRFPFRYTIDDYTFEELGQIFIKMVGEINLDAKWSVNITTELLNKFFKDNYKCFPHFGGDIETFLLAVKIQHGIRVFCLDAGVKKIIVMEDLINALKTYKLNKEIKEKSIDKYLQNTMYV